MDIESSSSKIFTAILLLPALGFFFSNEAVQSYAYFLLIITLVASAYFCHTYVFESKSLNFIRKCLACLSTAVLVLFLAAEVSDILLSVYKVSFGEEVTFLIKMILMISNMEGNLDLVSEQKKETAIIHNPIDTII
jgi:hypothetical protein